MTDQGADWLKKFSFALSAFGVDPSTVRVSDGTIHDVVEWECNPGDERCVQLALKLCEPENHNDWKMLTFGVRYGSTVTELREIAKQGTGASEEQMQKLFDHARALLNREK